MFKCVFEYGVIGRAIRSSLVAITAFDLREFAVDKHRRVDDYPYGGGPGMVMKPEPIFNAVEHVVALRKAQNRRVVLLSPAGRRLVQKVLRELASYDQLVLICGRYEGVDERVAEHLADDEISIGDYVLSGGEIPAFVIIDGVCRLYEGVLGSKESLETESFERGMLDYPHYTRPRDFRGLVVPDVLLSGNHAEIERWRKQKAYEKTLRMRPDLLKEGWEEASTSDEGTGGV